jgi:hypothetical protein
MTAERHDGPTPHGGANSIGVYVNLDTMEEVERSVATGIVVTEYTADGEFLFETIGTVGNHVPPPDLESATGSSTRTPGSPSTGSKRRQ